MKNSCLQPTCFSVTLVHMSSDMSTGVVVEIDGGIVASDAS